MKLRPYSRTDLPELVRLLNEAYKGEFEYIPYTDARLESTLGLASCILLAIDERDGIFGLAYLRQDWYGETVTLCAQPGSKQEEISSQLLTAIEPETKTGHITTAIETPDQNRLTFFRARGYETQSTLYQMVADLEPPRPLPQVPEGYLIRSLELGEEEALIRLANAAYNGDRLRPGILAEWKTQDPDFSVDWVQVAEYEGELVAAVVGSSDREYNEYYNARRGYLGPAATLPSHRGKGLSRALTARAMNTLHEHGMQAVCLHTWEGNRAALELIKHLGFRLAHEWRILGKIFR